MNKEKRNWLKIKRLEKGWSQVDLAVKLNVSNKTLSNIERGVANPSARLAYKIARELDFNAMLFFPEEEIA